MYGGPSAATPTCQPLPAGLLGYGRYCPYTATPQADGAWNAPDLVRARRLVTSSGTSGQMIDVWGANDELGVPRELPAYVASVLRSLGYRTHLHTVPIASISYAQRRGFQLSVDGDWSPRLSECLGAAASVLRLPRRLQQRLRLRSRARAEDAKRPRRRNSGIPREAARSGPRPTA